MTIDNKGLKKDINKENLNINKVKLYYLNN